MIIKIYSNDWLILEGYCHELIEGDDDILIDITSFRSDKRKLVCLTKKYSKIELVHN